MSDSCFSPEQDPEASDTMDAVGCACDVEAPVCVGDRRFECQEVWVRVDAAPCTEGLTCEALVGMSFVSESQHECGNSPEGPEFCTWTVDFGEQSYEASQSDTVQSGTYDCNGRTLTASEGPNEITGQLNEDGSLTWAGETYLPAK